MNLADEIKQRLIGVRQLAIMLDITVNTVYSWVSQGKIKSVKCGRLRKFDLRDIDEWIEKNKQPERKFR